MFDRLRSDFQKSREDDRVAAFDQEGRSLNLPFHSCRGLVTCPARINNLLLTEEGFLAEFSLSFAEKLGMATT